MRTTLIVNPYASRVTPELTERVARELGAPGVEAQCGSLPVAENPDLAGFVRNAVDIPVVRGERGTLATPHECSLCREGFAERNRGPSTNRDRLVS